MSASLTLIMPAWNAEKEIERSVRSVLAQSYRDLRLIVSLNPLGVLFALLLDALVQGLRLLDDDVQLADFAVNILDERF